MSYIEKNKQSFGVVAKDYRKYRGSYTDELYKTLLALTKNTKSSPISILDLGCGVGNSTEPILAVARKLKLDVSVTGCDPDVRMLEEARRSAKKNKLPITYVWGMAEKLPFESNQFDLVMSGAAFHWFATAKAMKEIKRTLKKGGVYGVFWAQSTKRETPVIGGALYKEYGFKGIPLKLRDLPYVKSLFVKAGFSKVKTASVPYVQKKTITEAIGLIKTNSGYATLSSQDKKEFLQKMIKEHKKVLGNKKLTLTQEIRICYGTS